MSIAYSAGSSNVESLTACSAQCLARSYSTNIYFVQGKYCNLHYGPDAFNNNVANRPYDFYDATCFTCVVLSCARKEVTTIFEISSSRFGKLQANMRFRKQV